TDSSLTGYAVGAVVLPGDYRLCPRARRNQGVNDLSARRLPYADVVPAELRGIRSIPGSGYLESEYFVSYRDRPGTGHYRSRPCNCNGLHENRRAVIEAPDRTLLHRDTRTFHPSNLQFNTSRGGFPRRDDQPQFPSSNSGPLVA